MYSPVCSIMNVTWREGQIFSGINVSNGYIGGFITGHMHNIGIPG